MKTLILTFAAVCILFTVNAQQKWISNYDLAKSEAINTGKLMVVDFWADWCNPCKVMEKEFWNNPDISILYENFVPVKINVDNDRNTPELFSVAGIPKVVIALPDGTVLWEKTGYGYGDDFSDIINSIPNNLNELYKFYFNIRALSKDSEIAFNIARQFQQLACQTSNSNLKNAFLAQDKLYFKKALKNNTHPSITCDIDVYLLLNEVYNGKPDRALKKFNKKIGGLKNCNNKELAHFFLATYYKKTQDMVKFAQEESLIKDENFLKELSNL